MTSYQRRLVDIAKLREEAEKHGRLYKAVWRAKQAANVLVGDNHLQLHGHAIEPFNDMVGGEAQL